MVVKLSYTFVASGRGPIITKSHITREHTEIYGGRLLDTCVNLLVIF
jgi:hypothetical protein